MTRTQDGTLRFGSLWGTELFVHWSLPVGGAVIWLVFGRSYWGILHYTLAYAALIALHEIGHLSFAKWTGLRVESITVGGEGGRCRHERPKTLRQAFLVSSGGLVFQFIAFFATCALIWHFGFPAEGLNQAFAKVFIAVNTALFVLNLMPIRINLKLETDGYLLALIVRHRWFGGDNPYPQVGEHSPVFQREKSLLDLGFSLPAGASYGVEIFNDDTTPLAFVIEVLTGKVRLTERDAVAKALMIHNRGGAVFPCRTLAQAQSLASEITLEAKNRGHALLCRTVPRNAEAS